jgi:hypothetical protein
MIAQRLNLRLFIDGVEVPVIGCKATFSEGRAASAEVQVVATDQIYEIEPRSFVTLFFYDNFDFVPKAGKSDFETGATTTIGSKDLRRWKLLFAGELVGISFAKRGSSRQATLVCMDHTNYWDFIKQHYINFRNAGIERFENAFLGVKRDRQKFFDVITQGVHSKLYTWLVKSKNANGEASLYLGTQRVLREMFFAANDFYATAFNRLRIGDQIVGLADDATAAKLFKLQFFEKFVKNRLGGAGGGTTVRQLVSLLLGPVFHTYVTVPCPKFDRKGVSLGFDPNRSDAEAEELNSEMIGRDNSWPGASLNYTIIKPDTWFLSPPLCNVVFPHMYSQLSFSRNFLQEPTRLFLRTSLTFTGTSKWLTERFYAPDFESFNDQLFGHDSGFFDRMASTILPHEAFSGLNPIMTWQPELSTFVAKGARREYLGRLTDYLFWKYRFSTRNVNVSGPFNPNLVPGYPGLVLDRVGVPGQITRHFMGNIATVVHTIDQTGGRTHFTMVGARTHTENIDFSDKGRTLEEITSRGTDGFLDDRYDPLIIGEEVYAPLFGIRSIVDLVERGAPLTAGNISAQDILSTEGVSSLSGPWSRSELEDIQLLYQSGKYVQAGVEYLLFLYRAALKTGANIDLFTQSITTRPKATFPEMMGTRIQFPRSDPDESAFSLSEIVALKTTDPDLLKNDGFFHSAVDPLAPDTVNATFVAVKKRTSASVRVKKKDPVEVSLPDGSSAVLPFSAADLALAAKDEKGKPILKDGALVIETTTFTTTTEKSEGNYQLQNLLESRRRKVEAYVASLRSRGLRG